MTLHVTFNGLTADLGYSDPFANERPRYAPVAPEHCTNDVKSWIQNPQSACKLQAFIEL